MFHERQEELPYRVVGEELLRIKEECKNSAESYIENLRYSGIGTHQLVDHGYSEFKGYCYAEIIQNYGDEDFRLLYNTTEGDEIVRRAWPQDIQWYNYDFDRIILGKSRVIDFRAPW